MKRSPLLSVLPILAGLLPAALPQEEKPARSTNSTTRFFEAEAERLTKELEGAWILLDYTDPTVPEEAGQASGFLTFHEGFATWLLAVDTSTGGFFGPREFLALESGAYRYRVDEQANLQLASVMSFTNNTSEGNVTRDRSGAAFEYTTRLENGVLELRDPDGVVISFRKVTAGDFPDAAGRRIEKQRSGTPAWATDEDR